MAEWKDIKKELFKDPDFVKEYEALGPEYELARSLIQARIDQKMTQQELAQKAGLSQVMISRLESGTSNPKLTTVTRVAKALNKRIELVASR